jgi:hypothetical protein
MKKLTIAAALLLSLTAVNAQDNKPALPDFMPQIYKSEWTTLTGLIKAEKWADADKLTDSYYKRVNNDDFRKDDAAILRYMMLNITAAALANGQIDNATALKKLKQLEGKRVITPTVTFKSKGILNLLLLSADGKSWIKCTTNKDADVIQMTELFEVAYPEMLQDTEKYDNRNFRLSGIIKTISADSPAKPHLDVTFSGTEIWDISPAR